MKRFFSRIKTFITRPDALQTGITASDAAMTLGIARATTKEHLLIGDQRVKDYRIYMALQLLGYCICRIGSNSPNPFGTGSELFCFLL
ncbi:uncharacterized protein LOC119980936 isoform X3 [Tripterygium wilfordii]|uniref:uncharacterized protein LOC119980936 isoform X3 n=1 Tax=Tripterygium wilfordii TaxID=458696 RepID=UPI0018F8497E|nr:uncharacterized protein LOC119980936 isoform X3 [Tripterygium wilfordii]